MRVLAAVIALLPSATSSRILSSSVGRVLPPAMSAMFPSPVKIRLTFVIDVLRFNAALSVPSITVAAVVRFAVVGNTRTRSFVMEKAVKIEGVEGRERLVT